MFSEKITIIVPVYNTERFLPRCIGSLTAQTHGNLQILLVDDGSSDRSLAVCHKYEAKDRRIRVLACSHAGVSCARNAGLSQADGDYITFVDSDDFVEPDYCEELLCALNENDADLVICGLLLCEKNRIKKGPGYPLQPVGFTVRDYDYSIMNMYPPRAWGVMYRSCVIESLSFSEDIHLGEDTFFWLEALCAAKKAYGLDRYLYYYVWRDESVSHRRDYSKDRLSVFLACERAVGLLKKYPKPAEAFCSYYYAWACLDFIRLHYVCPEMPDRVYRFALKRYRSLLRPLLSCHLREKRILKYMKILALFFFALCPRSYALYAKFKYGRKKEYVRDRSTGQHSGSDL